MKSYKQAIQKQEEIDKTLTALSFNPKSWVYIIHEEGTTLIYRSAFAVKYDDWYLIFTEHHGNMLHHNSDVKVFGLKSVALEELPRSEKLPKGEQ